MNPIDIMATLRKRNSSQSELGRRVGVSRQAINNVVRGRARSRRVERAISDVTGLSLRTLWPRWYAHKTNGKRGAA